MAVLKKEREEKRKPIEKNKLVTTITIVDNHILLTTFFTTSWATFIVSTITSRRVGGRLMFFMYIMCYLGRGSLFTTEFQPHHIGAKSKDI